MWMLRVHIIYTHACFCSIYLSRVGDGTEGCDQQFFNVIRKLFAIFFFSKLSFREFVRKIWFAAAEFSKNDPFPVRPTIADHDWRARYSRGEDSQLPEYVRDRRKRHYDTKPEELALFPVKCV